MEREKEVIIKYNLICPTCNKKIKGSSPSQVNYNMRIHLDKHIREEKKNE